MRWSLLRWAVEKSKPTGDWLMRFADLNLPQNNLEGIFVEGLQCETIKHCCVPNQQSGANECCCGARDEHCSWAKECFTIAYACFLTNVCFSNMPQGMDF